MKIKIVSITCLLILILGISHIYTSEITKYAGKCSLCILNGYQLCNKKCYTVGDSCNSTVSTTIDDCKENYATNNSICNKIHIVTSNDVSKPNLLEVNLQPGQWCQFMLYNAIYASRLKNTIANWTVNDNSTANVLFYETNTTSMLGSTLTTNIDLTQYYTPYSPYTRMIFNFSHVIVAANPYDGNTTTLFSIAYQNSILNYFIGTSLLIFFAISMIIY